MKTDFYTKTILTVIAVCLTIIVLKDFDFIPKAYANEPTNKTINELVKTNYAVVPINEDGSINVKVMSSSEIDVNINSISTKDELDVNIDEIGGGYVSYGGPISVEID